MEAHSLSSPRWQTIGLLVLSLAAGCTDGTTTTTLCVLNATEDGGQAIECSDGTRIEVADGLPGVDGVTCTATEAVAGTVDIACDDGTVFTVEDGADGQSCTARAEADGSVTIVCGGDEESLGPATDGTSCTVSEDGGDVVVSCDDGTEATVHDGDPGGTCSVSETEGGVRIECDDGTIVDVGDGAAGGDCTTHTDEATGDLVVECADGTSVIVEGGGDATVFGVATLAGASDHTGILVELEGTALSATTDADGSYEIDGIPPGTYAAHYSFGDYLPQRRPNVLALPGRNELPPVELGLSEQVGSGDVFVVDLCVDPETSEATALLWLEDYALVEAASPPPPPRGLVLTGGTARPGYNPLPLVAQGRLVHFDPRTGATAVLGEDVPSTGVACSPDGTAVALLENAELATSFEGDLVIWDGEKTSVDGGVSACGLEWSPSSEAIAYLTDLRLPPLVLGRAIAAPQGDLSVFARGSDMPVSVDGPVGCSDFFTAPVRPPLGLAAADDLPHGVFDSSPEYEWSPAGSSLRYLRSGGLFGTLAYYRLSDGDNVELSAHASWDPGVYSPDGDFIVYWADDSGSAEAYLFDTAAVAGPVTRLSDNGAAAAPWFAWSPNSQYVAHSDNRNTSAEFDLEVWDVGTGEPAGDVLAVNMSAFAWVFSPDDSGLLFAALEPNVPAEPAGNGGTGSLAFWDAVSETVAILSDGVETSALQASYSPSGDKLLFVQYPDGLVGDARLIEAGELADTPVRTGVFDRNGPQLATSGLATVWGPDGDSAVVLEVPPAPVGGFGAAPEAWLYSFVADDEVLLSADPLSSSLPVQYNAGGSALAVFSFGTATLPGGLDAFRGVLLVELTEWDVDALASAPVSASTLYASYSETGDSLFYLEVDPNQMGDPTADVFVWPALGSEPQAVDSGARVLSGFAQRADDAAYAKLSTSFPAVMQSGPYRVALP